MKFLRFSLRQLCGFVPTVLLLVLGASVFLPAQTENRLWHRLGSPPPRITGIVAIRDTVLVSAENGAYSITTTATSWVYQPAIPPGRLLQTTSGEVLVIGASVWFYSTVASVWLVSSNFAHRAYSQTLSQNISLLTQATVRMPEGYELTVTRGGVVVRLDSVWRPIISSSFDGTRGILGLVRVGKHLYCATERGVVCGEEITVAKASPFEPLAFKRFAWKPCDNGLVRIMDKVQVLGNRMITSDAWLSSDSGQTWSYRAQDSLRAIILVPTRDSSLFALTSSSSSSILVRSRNNGKTWINAGFTMPRGMRWFEDFRTKHPLPCFVGVKGTLTIFVHDTAAQRTLRPTHVLESQNGGLTWQLQEIQGLSDNVAVGDILQSPHGYLFAKDVAFQRPTLYRSDNNGKTWRPITIGRVPETLAIHPTTGTLFLSGASPMRSDDDGLTWTASQGLPFRSSGRFEGASEFVFGSDNVVLLNIRGIGLFRSRDGGRAFTLQESFPSQVYAIRTLPNGEFAALVAEVFGNRARSVLWISRNDGASWERSEGGLPSHDNFLIIDVFTGSNAEVFALSSHGIFRLEQIKTKQSKVLRYSAGQSSVLSSSAFQTPIPQERNISQTSVQIAPNPAQNHVNILFTMPVIEKVRCEIFSQRGELLQTVLYEAVSTASESLLHDVSGLPSGLYFCRVRGENIMYSIPFRIIR